MPTRKRRPAAKPSTTRRAKPSAPRRTRQTAPEPAAALTYSLPAEPARTKLRALVLSGGGARGVFEAGVLHALILSGVHFDILTGSSIGAINNAFFAEYLYQKAKGADARALDHRLRAYLAVWEDLEASEVVDFDSTRMQALIRDLSDFDLSVADALRVAWVLRGGQVAQVLSGIKIAREIAQEIRPSLKDYLELARDALAGRAREGALRELTEGYYRFLDRHEMRKGLFATAGLRAAFAAPRRAPGSEVSVTLLEPGRRLSEFKSAGVEARFTRANVRSGRLEVSAYAPIDNLIDPAFGLLPVRDKIVGDPSVVDAALASGAFPFVFPPLPLEAIYPVKPGESGTPNALLAALAAGPAEAAAYLQQVYQLELSEQDWQAIADTYPRAGDEYMDGGAIDNTPMGTAIDAAREAGASRLEVIVIMLDSAPERQPISHEAMKKLTGPEVGLRGLAFLGASQKARDVELAEVLTGRANKADRIVSELWQALPAAKKRRLEGRLRDWEGERLLPVDVVRIWPGELKLDTLQFDKRLGYDAANGRKALVDGCARALEALRNRWAQADPATLDETTQRSREKVLEVVQPKDGGGWHCAHMACRYRDVCPQAI